jgi:CheY-like chemotaxis protein
MLQALVDQGIETATPLMEMKGQHLHVAVPHAPVYVDADPTRLAQVIGNLLNNAAKYTGTGGHVWLRMRISRGCAVLRVRDDGIGIAPAMLPNVFELFTQVDSSLDRSEGGLGIGLTLVRTILQMHGGQVRARSPGLGRGSAFTLWLPIVAADSRAEDDPRTLAAASSGLPASAACAPAGPQPARHRRVLLIDDNVDAVESLAVLFADDHHDVRTAHEGESALALAQSFRPEVVVLDIGLPGMDGYEIARRLRASAGLEGVVLVALTGYGQEEDRRRALAAGFDHHLIKPANLAALRRLMSEPTPASAAA